MELDSDVALCSQHSRTGEPSDSKAVQIATSKILAVAGLSHFSPDSVRVSAPYAFDDYNVMLKKKNK